MARIDTEFRVRNVNTRRYIRQIRQTEGVPAAKAKVRAHLRRSNQQVTPKRTGRLRRSFRVRPQTTLTYGISWAAPYASFVDRRGKSRGFVNRVKRRAQATLRAEAARNA